MSKEVYDPEQEAEWQTMSATMRVARDLAWEQRRYLLWLEYALWARLMRSADH